MAASIQSSNSPETLISQTFLCIFQVICKKYKKFPFLYKKIFITFIELQYIIKFVFWYKKAKLINRKITSQDAANTSTSLLQVENKNANKLVHHMQSLTSVSFSILIHYLLVYYSPTQSIYKQVHCRMFVQVSFTKFFFRLQLLVFPNISTLCIYLM